MALTRRNFAKALSTLAIGGGSVATHWSALAQQGSVTNKAIEVENRLKARLGLAIMDSNGRRLASYNADQRFPMCSTFKAIASAAFLAKVDRGEDSLARRVSINETELVSYSPMTETRLGNESMSMGEICSAALTLSDNTAGNKILDSIGGPQGVTQFARDIGDEVFRLDRWETELNEAALGDPRDTSSPAAMTATLQTLLFGEVLSDFSRLQLQDWMKANKTGDAKVRAGVPSDWVVGDKTGGGNNGTMADIAAIWVPGEKPITLAVYMTETEASFDDRNQGIADIAKVLSLSFG